MKKKKTKPVEKKQPEEQVDLPFLIIDYKRVVRRVFEIEYQLKKRIYERDPMKGYRSDLDLVSEAEELQVQMAKIEAYLTSKNIDIKELRTQAINGKSGYTFLFESFIK